MQNNLLVLPRIKPSIRDVVSLSLLLVIGGCSGRPPAVQAPDWDATAMTEQVFTEHDKDGDGTLSEEELSAVPGLGYCLPVTDADGDRKLSKSEVTDRIKLYEEMRTGAVSFRMQILYRGRPLPGAQVKLTPEPFVASVLTPATGVTGRDGWVRPATPEFASDPAMQVGFYRIEVTSPHVEISEDYNVNTVIGVEVSAVTDLRGDPVFEVGKKRRKKQGK